MVNVRKYAIHVGILDDITSLFVDFLVNSGIPTCNETVGLQDSKIQNPQATSGCHVLNMFQGTIIIYVYILYVNFLFALFFLWEDF